MRTVAEILSEASHLSPDELARLNEGVHRLHLQSRAFRLHVGGREYRLARLSNQEYADFRRTAIAIDQDLGFLLQVHWQLRETGQQELDFPRLDAALTHLTGPTGSFDTWKGSFHFPFLMEFEANGTAVQYLFIVYNCRDSIYYDYRKVVSPGDERLKTHYYYPTDEAEFSRDESNRFILHFQGYLLGYIEGGGTRRLTPFVRAVEASQIVYGVCDGEFFEERFRSQEEREAALKSYRQRIAQESDPKPNIVQS